MWGNIYTIKVNQRLKSEKNEWKSFRLSLCHFCHVLHRLSKHFIVITFDVVWLTKSNVIRWNITLASFALVWFIPFKTLQKGEIFRSSQPPTGSLLITREDNLQVLEMVIIPYLRH